MIALDTLPLTCAGAATRRGPKHADNEDQCRLLDVSHPLVERMRRGVLYAVLDGVSTTPRGREAAEIGASRLAGFYDEVTVPRLASLLQLVGEIDWELREVKKGDAACTIALLWLASGMATVVHVGDSQVYRVRDGVVENVTRHKRPGGLAQFVGMGPRVAEIAQVWQEPLHTGDLFLLVTDGVTEVVGPDEIVDFWWGADGSCARAAQAVIREVDRRSGQDDATVVLVDVLAAERDLEDEVDTVGVGL